MTDFGIIGDRILIESLRLWAAGHTDLCLVAAAGTVGDLLGSPCPARPDCVLLDLSLSDGSEPAGNVCRLSRERYRVLVLSPMPPPEHITATVAAGARGYVTKDQDLAALAVAIRQVATGGFTYPQVEEVRPSSAARPRPRLSARENAVLHAYASGLTLDAAARRIGIRPATAKTYLARIKAKYAEVGRPAYTKLELAARLREDRAPAESRPPDPAAAHPNAPGERGTGPIGWRGGMDVCLWGCMEDGPEDRDVPGPPAL